MRVLLVEDDPTTRQMLSILLERCDIPCDTAEDGFQAIEAWQQGDYDVLLMDVQMPELDGVEATRRIRAREKEIPKRRRVTIIAMTAHLMPEDVEQCRQAGMDDMVPKPIDLERLLELIEQYGKASPM